MEQEKKKFKLFDFNRDGKGVEKEEVGPPNLKNFFKLFGRKFTRLLSLNLYILLQAIPAALILYLYVIGGKTPSILSPIYPALYGASQVIDSPVFAPLFSQYGMQTQWAFLSLGEILLIAAVAVLWFVVFGWLNVGVTYNLRSMVRAEPVFMWSDFWYAIRRNLKQGLILGVIDLAILGILFHNLTFFYNLIGTFAMDLMFYMTIALTLIYIFMRFYLYLMLITFDLSIGKLIKNAFIFALVGIKRNVMALLGILLLAFINFMLIVLLAPLGIILVVILPIVYFPACASFMAAYAAWPKIDELMIKPYQSEEDDGDGDMLSGSEEEALL